MRDVEYVGHSLERLRAETDAGRWQDQRAAAVQQVAAVERAIARALELARALGTEERDDLVAAAQALATHESALAAMTDPPRGWREIAGEAELVALLAEPVVGPVGPAYQQKETALKAWLERLPPTECRVLTERVRVNRPGDPVASELARFSPERRQRLIAFLEGARRREARRGPGTARIEEGPMPLPEPIRSELEAAAGRSLSEVRLHVDDRGAEVAASHGARAVAIGTDIHIADGHYAPETDAGRELIAHEVAHAIQATMDADAGARSEDAEDAQDAERDADLFAASFRSESAALVPEASIAHGTPMKAPAVPHQVDAAAVKRERSRRERSARSDDATAYAAMNQPEILAAIVGRWAALTPPEYPLVYWVGAALGPHVGDAFAKGLATRDRFTAGLVELLHPADVTTIIDRHRPLVRGLAGRIDDRGRAPVGPLFWREEVGIALAIEAELRLRESLGRMAVRYATLIEARHPAAIAAPDIVPSHPMDVVAAHLLCDLRIARPIAPRRGAKRRRDVRTEVTFLRDYRWLGEVDPGMWNWIEVKEPRDAVAEDVAATLGLEHAESKRAYAIVASPPFFQIPPAMAARFDVAVRYRPRDHGAEEGALALAASGLATEAAIAQGAAERRFDRRGIPVPPSIDSLANTIERSASQLERAKADLAGSRLWQLLLPALAWVTKLRDHLLAIPAHRLIALAPVIEGQQSILFEAVGAIGRLAPLLGADPSGHVASVVRQYAIAAGESHLLVPARTQLAKAIGAESELTVNLLEQSAYDTRNSIEELRANETTTSFGSRAASQHVAELQQRIIDMRARRAAGLPVDDAEPLIVAAELAEEALLARGRAIFLNLDNLAVLAGASTAAEIQQVAGELKVDILDRHAERKAARMRGFDPRLKREVANATNAATDGTRQALEAFLGRAKLDKRIPAWIEAIEDRDRLLRAHLIASTILLLVATAVGAQFAAGMVAAAVRGLLLAEAATATVGITWGVRIARGASALAGLGTDAAINAAVEIGLTGKSYGDAFADNFLANAAVRVALRPVHNAVASWGAGAQDVANLGLWERNVLRGKMVVKGGAILTLEMVTGAAASYVVHRARHDGPPDEQTAADWAVQGGSIAIGAFVSRWLHAFESRIAKLLERKVHLQRRAHHMRALASRAQRTGDKDAALELLVARKEALDAEATLIHELASKGKLAPDTARTMLHGNEVDAAATANAAYETLPLRLAGLEADDSSARIWAGTSEQIAIALHQAERAGLQVTVLQHDSAARVWKVRVGDRELTLLERARHGQPRAPTLNPSDADRTHARRYAESAAFMQHKWEQLQKTKIDARDVIEFDYLQLGAAYAGVVNQATLPAHGDGIGSKVVVYDHTGTLSNRGTQQLGQAPDKFDAPGVRASEQAPRGTEWVTSDQLGRALDIGRLEMQTPAYRGTVVTLEARPKGTLDPAHPEPWTAPHRMFRIKVRDGVGASRWFYVDRYDNLGGLGPGNLKSARDAAGTQLDAMLERGQVLRGEDPDYVHKLRGGRTLVWGGSPVGAWAAEAAHLPRGASTTIVGDTRTPSDWPTLLRDYEELTFEIATREGGDIPAHLAARRAAIEARITAAHGAMAIRRNTKPGAPYAKHPTQKRDPRDIQIEFGTPSKLQPLPDGRVLVTVGTGEGATASVYDQVVLAHGQDPGAAGAPGALLGRGAEDGDAQVPAGTIALRPILAPANDGRPPTIVGLESIDPPGVRLLGAAFASRRMMPWVEASHRRVFAEAVDAMAGEHATTRDHGNISDDSRTVSPGVEVQRDRIPRANEVLGARVLRLPGPMRTLELDPADPASWDEHVRAFFAENLRATAKWVRVQRRGGGRSKAVVYQVWVDGNEVGTFKLFERGDDAANESRMLRLLENAKLQHMSPVRERGEVKVKGKHASALLMDSAPGRSVKQMIEALPQGAAERSEGLAEIKLAVVSVAQGLAEMHSSFESGHLMTKDMKLEDAQYFLDKAFRAGGRETARVRAALGEADFERVKAQLEGPLLAEFLAANVPATAYHGDANAGNFILADEGTRRKLSVIDVGAMSYSVDASNRGTKTGAADVARFLGSLETFSPGALGAADVAHLRDAFLKAYHDGYSGHRLDRSAYAAAERWYRTEMLVTVVAEDPTLKPLLLETTGLERR